MKTWTTETWVAGAPVALRASVARIGRELEPALA